MKNLFTMFVAALCVWSAVLYVGAANNRNQLLQIEVQILQDQVSDYSHQISQLSTTISQLSAKRTYEEGLRDGFENTTNWQYVAGYHAAMSQAETVVQPKELVTTK